MKKEKDFLTEFMNRGYYYQCTNHELLETLSQNGKIVAYIGFDCTATSLHVGSLMQIMILRLLQQHGHKPIVIVGGGTSKIGDPSFKDEARKMISDETIAQNMSGIKMSLSKFIQFSENNIFDVNSSDAVIVDNNDWLGGLKYIDFLRDFGSLFSVNRMLTMDSVKMRLEREQNLSFLEFNYMLLQAYDFLFLSENYKCNVQLGGSDQWGNIVSGVDLIRRKSSVDVAGLTTPLLTTSSGVKMGKTVDGAVWLNENMCSPYHYYQYWRNTEDGDVVRFAKLFAEYDDVEQCVFEELCLTDINDAKKQLAYRLTTICHGKECANLALETSIKVFEHGGIDDNLPSMNISYDRLHAGVKLYELIAEASMVDSKSEARQLIKGGGVRINDTKISDENYAVSISDVSNDAIKLSCGKKRHMLIKPVV